MAQRGNRRESPRLGTRRKVIAPGIVIEALEPRTLFSGGHGVLRAGVGADFLQADHAVGMAGLGAGNGVLVVQLSQPNGARPRSGAAAAPPAIRSVGNGSAPATPAQPDMDPGMRQIAAIAGKVFAGLDDQTLDFIATHDPGPFGRLLRLERSGHSTLIQLPLPEGAGTSGHALPHKGSHDSAQPGGQPDPQSGPAASPGQDPQSGPAANPGQEQLVVFGPNGVRIVLNVGDGVGADPITPANSPGPSHQTPPTVPAPSPQPPVAIAAVTPLALTPAAQDNHETSIGEHGSSAPLSVQAVPPADEMAIGGPSGAQTTQGLATSAHPLGMLAIVAPGAMQASHAVAALSNVMHAAGPTLHAAAAIAGHAAADLFTAMVPSDSAPGTVAYNFMHLDASTFNDAAAAFAGELASLSAPTGAPRDANRAWEITAAVLGLDAICFAYLYRKSRRERLAQIGQTLSNG